MSTNTSKFPKKRDFNAKKGSNFYNKRISLDRVYIYITQNNKLGEKFMLTDSWKFLETFKVNKKVF